VSARLNSDAGISYTEFSYQLLQGMDFLELYRRYGCTLQTGGSDQWGNLTAGSDLIHRTEQTSVHLLATPLITKADGTKFGKTETGTVWLDPAMTSPYAFYQFWLNTDDRDVSGYLRTFTFRGQEELAELDRLTRERPAARQAQRTLAADVTSLVHGPEATARVEAASRALFGRGELAGLDPGTLADAAAELPQVRPGRSSQPVVELFTAAGLVPSRSAARRAIAEGGAYLNNVKVDSPDATAGPEVALHGRWLILRRGRKSLAAVDLADGTTPPEVG
jgi:tyrosyl-tRNA synthetase